MKKKGREKRKREKEEQENETVTVERRCDGFVSVEAFAIFGQGRDVESLRICLLVSRRLGWMCGWCLM